MERASSPRAPGVSRGAVRARCAPPLTFGPALASFPRNRQELPLRSRTASSSPERARSRKRRTGARFAIPAPVRGERYASASVMSATAAGAAYTPLPDPADVITLPLTTTDNLSQPSGTHVHAADLTFLQFLPTEFSSGGGPPPDDAFLDSASASPSPSSKDVLARAPAQHAAPNGDALAEQLREASSAERERSSASTGLSGWLRDKHAQKSTGGSFPNSAKLPPGGGWRARQRQRPRSQPEAFSPRAISTTATTVTAVSTTTSTAQQTRKARKYSVQAWVRPAVVSVQRPGRPAACTAADTASGADTAAGSAGTATARARGRTRSRGAGAGKCAGNGALVNASSSAGAGVIAVTITHARRGTGPGAGAPAALGDKLVERGALPHYQQPLERHRERQRAEKEARNGASRAGGAGAADAKDASKLLRKPRSGGGSVTVSGCAPPPSFPPLAFERLAHKLFCVPPAAFRLPRTL